MAITPVTCRVESCTERERTSVTCNFHTHLNDSTLGRGINVVRYPPGSSGAGRAKDVIQCLWPTNADQPHCIVEEGYDFNNIITDRLTVELPEATEDFAGFYMCLVIPQADFVSHACECELTVKERTNTTDELGDLTTATADDAMQCGQKCSCPDQNVMVAIVVLAVLLSLLLLIFIGVLIRCHVFQHGGRGGETPVEARYKGCLTSSPVAEGRYQKRNGAVIYKSPHGKGEPCELPDL